MKLTIKAGALANALEAPSRLASDRKNVIETLKYVHCSTAQGAVFTATDGATRLIVNCEAQILEPGAVLIPAARIRDLAKLAGAMADVTIATGPKLTIEVSVGTSRSKLSVLPVADFPETFEPQDSTPLTISPRVLRGLIERVMQSVPAGEQTHAIPGASFIVKDGVIRMAATDTYTATFVSARVNSDVAINCVIHKLILAELLSFVSDYPDESVEVQTDADRIVVSNSARTFVGRLFERAMPNIERAIPVKPAVSITVDRDLFKLAVQRAAVIVNAEKDKLRGISLVPGADGISVEATNSIVGESQENVPATFSGPAERIGMQIEFLLDYLRHAAAGNVVMEHTAKSGVLFTESKPGDIDYRYLSSQMIDKEK